MTAVVSYDHLSPKYGRCLVYSIVSPGWGFLSEIGSVQKDEQVYPYFQYTPPFLLYTLVSKDDAQQGMA